MHFSCLFVVFFVVLNTYRHRRRSDAKTTISILFSIINISDAPEACKDACCGDYTCAVWQFDADGYRNQCWYGPACDEFGYDKNCDEKEGDLTWTYGGIRKMGCDQAPNCVGLCESDDYYYYIRIM